MKQRLTRLLACIDVWVMFYVVLADLVDLTDPGDG